RRRLRSTGADASARRGFSHRRYWHLEGCAPRGRSAAERRSRINIRNLIEEPRSWRGAAATRNAARLTPLALEPPRNFMGSFPPCGVRNPKGCGLDAAPPPLLVPAPWARASYLNALRRRRRSGALRLPRRHGRYHPTLRVRQRLRLADFPARFFAG